MGSKSSDVTEDARGSMERENITNILNFSEIQKFLPNILGLFTGNFFKPLY